MATTKRTLALIPVVLLVACTCLVGSTRAGNPPDAYEPNGSIDTARAITPGTYDCNFDNIADVDYYNITIPSGDEITIDITPTVSVVVALLGPTGTLATKDIGAVRGSLSHVAAYTGNHTIMVTGTGEYTMAISVETPGQETPGFAPALILALVAASTIALLARTRRKTNVGC